jgi:signal peptidase II
MNASAYKIVDLSRGDGVGAGGSGLRAMAQRSFRAARSRLLAPSPRAAGILAASLVLCLDQLSKFVVAYRLALPQRGMIELLPFFDLRWEENVGISLNLLPAGDSAGRWLLVLLTGTICSGVALWLWREQRRGRAIALALILGGALGNIVDRIGKGFVVDFADLHFGGWRPFLIFNLADVAISIGVLLLLGLSLRATEQKPDR